MNITKRFSALLFFGVVAIFFTVGFLFNNLFVQKAKADTSSYDKCIACDDSNSTAANSCYVVFGSWGANFNKDTAKKTFCEGNAAYCGDGTGSYAKDCGSAGCDPSTKKCKGDTTPVTGSCKWGGDVNMGDTTEYKSCISDSSTQKTCATSTNLGNCFNGSSNFAVDCGTCGCSGNVCASESGAKGNTCTNPGSIVNHLVKDDGATYLQICGANSTVSDIRCSLTLAQRQAAACYYAKNGSAGDPPTGTSVSTYVDNSDPKNPKTVYTVYDSLTGKSADCDTILGGAQNDISDMPQLNNAANNNYPGQVNIQNLSDYYSTKAREIDLAGSLNDLELACCLTSDHCKSYGCDENIVYDWYYGCTKIDFGPTGGLVKNGKVGSCDADKVCSANTWSCGSKASTYRSCVASMMSSSKLTTSTNSTVSCWSDDQACVPTSDCSKDKGQHYCASFGCAGSSKTAQTWDDKAGAAKCSAGQTTSVDSNACSTAGGISAVRCKPGVKGFAQTCPSSKKWSDATDIDCAKQSTNGACVANSGCGVTAAATACAAKKCNSSTGEITVLDTTKSSGTNCVYGPSTDKAESGCKQCVIDMMKNAVTCTSPANCAAKKCNSSTGEITVLDTTKSSGTNCVYGPSTDKAESGCKQCTVDTNNNTVSCTSPADKCTPGCVKNAATDNYNGSLRVCSTQGVLSIIDCTKNPNDTNCKTANPSGCTATPPAQCNTNAGETLCNGVCASPDKLTKPVGKDANCQLACDCTLGSADGNDSCTTYPNQKQICSVDGAHYYTSQLSPATGKNYCVYSTSNNLTDCAQCKQLDKPGSDGKYITCGNQTNCKKEGEACSDTDTTGAQKCCSGQCSNGICKGEKTECKTPTVKSKSHSWNGNSLMVTATTDVKAQCKFDTKNVDFSQMQYTMDDANGQGYASNDGTQHQGSISAGSAGGQNNQSNQNYQNNQNNNQSSDQGNQSVNVFVSCKNAETGCENTPASSPQEEPCNGQQGNNPNQNPNQNPNENQNQTPLTVSSCTAQANGTGTSATVNVSATTNGPATCTYNINGSGSKPMQTGNNQSYTDSVTASSLQSGNNTFNITCKANSTSSSSNNSSSNNNNSNNNNSNSNSNNNSSNSNNSNNSPTFTGTATCTAQYTNSAANAPQISGCSAALGTGTNSTVLQITATTQSAAACSYGVNADKNTVTAGQPMQQSSDKLTFTDNVQLTSLQAGNNVIYVRCKSSETSGEENKNPCKIQYQNTAASAITISNPLPTGTVTTTPTTLSVVTNVAATCRFSTTDQDYNSMPPANQFIQTQQGSSNTYAQQYQMAVENNKSYQFYVRCRDTSGNVSATSTQITFSTNLTGAGVLAITNPQPTGNVTGTQVTISVQTSVNATCTYTKDGASQPFTNTGGVYHSSQVTLTTTGTQTFPVACVNSANANDKQTATITFTANVSGPSDCAQVDAQDKKPDSALGNVSSYDSSYDYQGNNTSSYNTDLSSNAQYCWQSQDVGTLGQFSHVNWNAGYRFTPNSAGWITELCGFFDSTNTDSKITLYDSSYRGLASVNVQDHGTWSYNSWNCQTISPVQLTSGQSYYVVAKIDNGPIYYKNQTNMLPKNGPNFTINEGVRELDDEPFGTKINSYKYMVFGLVDVRFALDLGSVGYGNDKDAPQMSDPQPSGNINTSSPVLHVQTADNAYCKFDRWDRTWENMRYVFSTSGGRTHEQKICDLTNGDYTYFVRCSHSGKSNTKSLRIHFTVQSSGGNTGEPQISNPKPSGTVSANSVVLSVNTPLSASAQCKFDTNDVSYNSMHNGMTAATDPANSSSILNSASVGNLNDGNYTYYVRCRDYLGNTNTTSTVISFKVGGSQTNDAVPPQISNGHVSNSSASIGTAVKITVQVTDNQGIASVVAHIRNASGQTVGSLTLLDDGTNDDNVAHNGIYGYSWNTSGLSAGTYYIDVTAVDSFGNSINQTNIATVTLN